jgi:hypothetical protein
MASSDPNKLLSKADKLYVYIYSHLLISHQIVFQPQIPPTNSSTVSILILRNVFFNSKIRFCLFFPYHVTQSNLVLENYVILYDLLFIFNKKVVRVILCFFNSQ